MIPSGAENTTTWTLTLAAIVIALLYYVSRQKAAPKLPGAMQRAGNVDLSPSDFGKDDEVMRDFARAYAAHGLHILRIGGGASTKVEPLVPPADRAPEACKMALAGCLEGADGTGVGEAPLQRLISMLSVGPAFAVLTNTGCPPMLQHHRFVIVHSASRLHALIVGFMGEPGSLSTPWLLTIASPNLLDKELPPLGEPLECTVGYELSAVTSSKPKIEDELRRQAARWASAFG